MGEEQVPPVDGEEGPDTESSSSEGTIPRKYLQLIMNKIKEALSSISGSTNIATVVRRAAVTENNMNYRKLSKKLFEAVSKEDMPCNKPRASTRPGKKKMVKACEGGKEKIVHFGAKGYGHNYSPKARKSFRARHKCGEKKSKLSAQYWACKNLWAGPKGSKASCPSNRQCKT